MQKLKSDVWKLLHSVSPSLEHQLRKRFSRSCHENWGYRIRQVIACPDNSHIPRTDDAGKIINGFQIMHNGIKVVPGSYYGDGPIELLRKNRGVHEPQEERIFQEVLKTIPPRSIMIELGAYWAFYSMWFRKTIPDSQAYMIEPAAENLVYGQGNFAANCLQGEFLRAYVGAASGSAPDGTKIISPDDFVTQHGLAHISLLHSDIQGFELEMLHGCDRTIREGKISWFFISTHNDALHEACESFLCQRGFVTVASIPPTNSFSVDGILVSRSPRTPAIPPITLSRKKRRSP